MTFHPTRRRALGILAAASVLSLTSRAVAERPALPRPLGKPILRVGGRIKVVNDGVEAVFDRDMLEALGARSFATATPWTEGVPVWEGVPLSVLMDHLGAEGTTIRATALNDYVTELPMKELARDGAILAMRRDGQPMPVSDKGPLFVVYPFDQRQDLKRQEVFARCAWQLARLDVF